MPEVELPSREMPGLLNKYAVEDNMARMRGHLYSMGLKQVLIPLEKIREVVSRISVNTQHHALNELY